MTIDEKRKRLACLEAEAEKLKAELQDPWLYAKEILTSWYVFKDVRSRKEFNGWLIERSDYGYQCVEEFDLYQVALYASHLESQINALQAVYEAHEKMERLTYLEAEVQ